MLSVLFWALLLGNGAPSPEPSAVPPTPLREIGSVRASICTTIVVHANGAISDALANDQDLAIVINRLRTTDLDNANEMERRRRINDLMLLAERIRTASSAGDAEVKRLRELAANSPDPKRKEELKTFADALGGALYRQKKVAVDLDKFVTNIEGRRATFEAAQETASFKRSLGSDPSPIPTPFGSPTPDPVNRVLRDMADEFTNRNSLILGDEGVAADHSLGATTGC